MEGRVSAILFWQLRPKEQALHTGRLRWSFRPEQAVYLPQVLPEQSENRKEDGGATSGGAIGEREGSPQHPENSQGLQGSVVVFITRERV